MLAYKNIQKCLGFDFDNLASL